MLDYVFSFFKSIFAVARPVRLSARISGFHPGERGSIPLRAAFVDREREGVR